MRPPLLALAAALALALLALPAALNAAPPVRSAIFYYSWYSTPAHDGYFTHWTQGGRQAPVDVASSFFPARGAYSSADPRVMRAQMREIASAGVDQVVTSWWGRESLEDKRLVPVMRAARQARLDVAIHLEPYPGRTAESVAADLAYFRGLGIRDVYVYDSMTISAEEWSSVTRTPHGLRLFAQTNRVGFAARAGFQGFYTYDILLYHGAKFDRLCVQARRAGILCAPSVGPGYSALHATGDTRQKPRRNGATYDSMWRAALNAGADFVTITSYNEWNEGTQIEPARRGGRYESYDGAYGLRGRTAQRAYITRTAYWTAKLRG